MFYDEIKEKTWLWYVCYRHLNFYELKIVHQKNAWIMITNLPWITISSQVLEEYVVSK